MPDRLVPFLVVVAVLTVTPGPDMALVLRNGVRGGSQAAWRTGLGCCAGIAVHAACAVAGLSAILVASATAFTVVKLLGAAYLVFLGVSALLHARGSSSDTGGAAAAPAVAGGSERAFRQGFTSNLLNPKIALLFLTLIPQFVAPGEAVVATTSVLAAVFLAIAVLWWRLFSLAISVLGRVLSRAGVRRVLDRATGSVLIALGLKVAITD